MTQELEEFKQQAALDYFELRRELDAALEQVQQTGDTSVEERPPRDAATLLG
jgi:hypothetical protein